jgi:plastocyanin
MTNLAKALVATAILVVLVFWVSGRIQASGQPQVIQVTMRDYQLELSQHTITPGRPVKFVVTNAGSTAHQFVVEPFAGVNAPSIPADPVIGSGTSRTILHTFGPGVFRVTCGIADHAEKGMINVLAADPPEPARSSLPVEFLVSFFLLAGLTVFIVGDSLGLHLTPTPTP